MSVCPNIQATDRRAAWISGAGRRLLLAFLSFVLAIYIVGPIAWVLISSVQREADLVGESFHLFPERVTLQNFEAIFDYSAHVAERDARAGLDPASGEFVPSAAQNLLPSLVNSFQVGAVVALLNIVFSLFAAYAIAKLHFRGRRTALYTILATRVVPDVALIVPMFLVLRNIGLIDSTTGLVIAYLAVTLPFTIFILINYIEGLPADLAKAARVDGCNHFQVLCLVMVPISMPAIVASLMFAFLTSWNEFVLALILTQTIASQTLPVIISGFVFDFTTSFSFINAAGVVAIIPPVVLAVLFERYIVGGLTAGSVKG